MTIPITNTPEPVPIPQNNPADGFSPRCLRFLAALVTTWVLPVSKPSWLMSENEKKSFKLPKRPKKPAVPDSVKANKAKGANPVWFLPVALTLMIIGLLWIMVY